MFKTIRTIVFLLAWIPLAVFAADTPVSEADLAAYKELAQTKLDAAKESLQKDREKTEVRLDSQDKRIGDLSFTITAFGAFLTVLVLVAGGVGWVSVRDRTREETRETAKKWFEEKTGELEQEIAALRQHAQESHDLIEKLKYEAKSHFQSVKDNVREQGIAVIAEMQKNIGNLSGKTESGEPPAAQGKDGEALEQLEQAIRHKPEAEYDFDDWNTRAFSAWHKNDFEGAARYWKEAAQTEDATDAQIAQSLFYAGVALGQMDRNEEAIAVYDEVDKRFGDAPEVALREQVAKALFNKGVALGQLDRNEEAIAVYDEVDRRFGAAPEAALREQVAKALFNKGVRLGEMNRNEEAIAAYDEVDRRFGDAPEAALRELVAMSLVNKGGSLGQLKRNEEAIAACDEVDRRYGAAPEAALREQVARALGSKGVRLGEMDRNEEAIAVYDEVDKRYGAAPEAALREQVAKVLLNKGVRLGEMNRSEDEIAAYEEVVERYGDAPDVALRKRVARALNGKGFALLCRAKEYWAEEATRQADLQEAAALFERAIGEIEGKPMVWGNQAYAAFLLGRPEAVRPLLQQALQQGGERLYKGTLDDLAIHPVPPDTEFRDMLEELWAEVKPKE